MIKSLPMLLSAILVLAPAQPRAEDIGNWFVQITKDPFSPKKKSLAITASDGQGALAIRCFPDDGLSVVVMPKSTKTYPEGETISFKYRADEGDIVDDKAVVFGSVGVQLPNAAQILHDAQHAHVLNLRMETPDGLTTDFAFNPRGGTKALRQIVADCGSDGGEKANDAAKGAGDNKK